MIRTVYKALKEVLGKKRYAMVFILTSLLSFLFFILFPAFSITGNDVLFQLSQLNLKSFFTILFISLGIGMIVSLQAYQFSRRRVVLKSAGSGFLGAVFGVFGGIVGTATCISCVAAVFGFLGAGTLFFLIQNRLIVIFFSAVLIFISLYLISRSVLNECRICR